METSGSYNTNYPSMNEQQVAEPSNNNNNGGNNYPQGGSNYSQSMNREPMQLFCKVENVANMDAVFIGKSDPRCSLYHLAPDGARVLIGETEAVDNQENVEFKTPITVDFSFEFAQNFVLVCYDMDPGEKRDVVGEAQFQLSDVIMAREEGLACALYNNGKQTGNLKMIARKVMEPQFEYKVRARMEHVKDIEWFSNTDPYVIFERPCEESLDANMSLNVRAWRYVYRTEWKADDLNPEFKPFSCSAIHFNRGHENAWIRFTLMDHSKSNDDDLIGRGFFSVAQVLAGTNRFGCIDEQGKNVGDLIFEEFSKERRVSLVDYINFGLHLSTVVAFDLTNNFDDSGFDESTLKQLKMEQLAKYEEAFRNFGHILQPYDSDNLIPAYACFRYKPSDMGLPGDEESFCHPLNGNFDSPHINGFENILPLLRNVVQTITPKGEGRLAPVIQNAVQAAASSWQVGPNIYNLVVIFTHGAIRDTGDVLELINQARGLPLTILLVGVAGTEMSQPEVIDKAYRRGERDVVHFIDYQKYCGDSVGLTKSVFEVLPGLIVDFYRRMNIFPN